VSTSATVSRHAHRHAALAEPRQQHDHGAEPREHQDEGGAEGRKEGDVELHLRRDLCLAHHLIRKPVSTFRDDAQRITLR
jgi:hypothetical protein